MGKGPGQHISQIKEAVENKLIFLLTQLQAMCPVKASAQDETVQEKRKGAVKK